MDKVRRNRINEHEFEVCYEDWVFATVFMYENCPITAILHDKGSSAEAYGLWEEYVKENWDEDVEIIACRSAYNTLNDLIMVKLLEQLGGQNEVSADQIADIVNKYCPIAFETEETAEEDENV